MQNEKLNPIHHLLKNPIIYDTLQSCLNYNARNNAIFSDYFAIRPTDRILDFGCGPARYRKHIPTQHYTGIDFNPAHIAHARELHPNDTFICGDITQKVDELGRFDKILMMGVLHHLSDDEVDTVLQACRHLLKPGGTINTADPVYEEKQNPIARLLNKLDQGNHVRYSDHYQALLKKHFETLDVVIRRDLLRLPYSRQFMIASFD